MRFDEVTRGNRVFVIPQNTFFDDLSEQPDPPSKAVRLVWLNGCPIGPRHPCVYIDKKNITSFCIHMGSYPDRRNGHALLETVNCRYPGTRFPLRVQFLTTSVEDCLRRGICVGSTGKCEALQDVARPIGNDASKPHFLIICP
jgi:hypothetical protein